MPLLSDRQGFSKYLQATLARAPVLLQKHSHGEMTFAGPLQLAHDAIRSDRVQEAYTFFTIAVAILIDQGELCTPDALSVLAMLAEGLHKVGSLSHAFSAYDLLGELLADQSDDAEPLVEVYITLARIAADAVRNFDTPFEDAFEIYELLLRELEQRFNQRGDTVNALKYGYDLLKHQIHIHGEYDVEVALTAANLSTSCIKLGVYKSAAQFARQALSIYSRINDRRGEGFAVANHNLGLVLSKDGHYKDAIEAFRQSLEIAETLFASDDGRIREIRGQLEETQQAASNNRPVIESLPGQPREVVARQDGTRSFIYDGLPDSDDLQDVINMSQALLADGILGSTKHQSLHETTALTPKREGIPPLPPFIRSHS